MKKLFPILTIFIGIAACDDVVDIPLDTKDPFLVVDAFLTNTADTQRIVLNYTQPYLDNSKPDPVLDATVLVVELETDAIYNFSDEDNDGVYEWFPASGEKFGTIGNTYTLALQADGHSYGSISEMDSVPSLDSITFEYNKADAFIQEDWYYGEFWSTDLPGSGNTYWIKSFKNGEFLGKPEDINLAFDAAFGIDGEFDNLPFIQPIRTAITPFDNEEGNPPSPYKIGDVVRVEIHAVSYDAWFFLFRVQDETAPLPGFAQLFANPLSNVPTNIFPETEGLDVVGFFSVSAVSSLEVTVSDETIVDRIPD